MRSSPMSGRSACRPATSKCSRCKAPAALPSPTNNLPALDRDKAQFLVIAGKKRTEAAWPAGRYTATYRVTRDGAEVLRKTFEVEAGSR